MRPHRQALLHQRLAPLESELPIEGAILGIRACELDSACAQTSRLEFDPFPWSTTDPWPADVRLESDDVDLYRVPHRSASATNVVPVSTRFSWTDLVAVPEVYATAWCGLRGNLNLKPGQTVLVRGATSAVGQAAVNIAADLGATVIATTRNPARETYLRELGADRVLIDDGRLAEQVREMRLEIDAVLDLVGNSVLRDSLLAIRPRGAVCQVGFLGGLAPVDGFNPIADLPTGVQFSFFGSFVLGLSHSPSMRSRWPSSLAKWSRASFTPSLGGCSVSRRWPKRTASSRPIRPRASWWSQGAMVAIVMRADIVPGRRVLGCAAPGITKAPWSRQATRIGC